MNPLTRQELLLLVLWGAEGKPLSPVQLQKTLFLLKKKAPTLVGHDFYNFEPYNYGPFDSNVYSDAELMEKQGVVSIETPPWQRWKEYLLTPSGHERAGEIARHLPTGASDYLKRLVGWVRSLDFETLLRHIYSEFPEFRKNSVFQGDRS